MRKSRQLFSLLVVICVLLSGCMSEMMKESSNARPSSAASELPEIPEKLSSNADGIPVLKVFNASSGQIEEMNLEDYVMGVVAGEMKNDWPIEALKAQAILARTFVLKFCATKDSRHDGADISTDVEEAQAYAPENINDSVRQAVEETKGMVMSANGEYPYAWFFAHSGGMTELPSVALDYNEADPDYLAVVESPDSDKAPEDVRKWTASFTFDEIQKACASLGSKVGAVKTVEFGERGESGRLKTLNINGESVSAPSFRIAIGANKLKSTLIDRIDVGDGEITFHGSGFGHGVGMSQWGAYALAEEGKSAEQIVRYYFRGVDIVELW